MAIGFLSFLGAAIAVAVTDHELAQRRDIDDNLSDVANLKSTVDANQKACKSLILT